MRKIVGIGELLWDMFPSGAKFGGAPANFSCAVAELSHGQFESVLVSGVGRDELGDQAIEELQSHGVSTHFVQRSDRPTGQVLVSIDAVGQASYEFANDTAWDHLQWDEDLAELAATADVVCFGTLGQRSEPSRTAIQRFLRATKPDCVRILDLNLRSPHWTESVIRQSLEHCHALKLNEQELQKLAQLLQIEGEVDDQLKEILVRHGWKWIALTCGAEGSVLVTEHGETSRLLAVPTEVSDTVGAGDAFTAALAIGYLQGLEFADLHRWAGEVAAFVCSQSGATPRFPESLQWTSSRST